MSPPGFSGGVSCQTPMKNRVLSLLMALILICLSTLGALAQIVSEAGRQAVNPPEGDYIRIKVPASYAADKLVLDPIYAVLATAKEKPVSESDSFEYGDFPAGTLVNEDTVYAFLCGSSTYIYFTFPADVQPGDVIESTSGRLAGITIDFFNLFKDAEHHIFKTSVNYGDVSGKRTPVIAPTGSSLTVVIWSVSPDRKQFTGRIKGTLIRVETKETMDITADFRLTIGDI